MIGGTELDGAVGIISSNCAGHVRVCDSDATRRSATENKTEVGGGAQGGFCYLPRPHLSE